MCGRFQALVGSDAELPPSPFLIVAQKRNKIFLGDEFVTDRFAIIKSSLRLVNFCGRFDPIPFCGVAVIC
jgi:hypothetical protein